MVGLLIITSSTIGLLVISCVSAGCRHVRLTEVITIQEWDERSISNLTRLLLRLQPGLYLVPQLYGVLYLPSPEHAERSDAGISKAVHKYMEEGMYLRFSLALPA